MAFMYLTYNDFAQNRSQLQIRCKDNLIIVMFTSNTCPKCKSYKKNFEKLNSIFPEISLAYCSIDYPNGKVLELLQKINININYVPTFALFKLGIFNRILNISQPSGSEVQKALKDELSHKFKPYNSVSHGYLPLIAI